MIRSALRRTLKSIVRHANGYGSKKKCYICGKTFDHFSKLRGGSKGKSQFRKKLDMVGSDIDNFRCMYCGCHDRERHLFMFFDKLELWSNIRNTQVLHFAPEPHLASRISSESPSKYIKADLYPKRDDVERIDATTIGFNNNEFDLIIANHILEHIADYIKALREFFRVLKPGGIAILQTPYSRLLKRNFEDEGVNSDELRVFFHGQKNHMRTFAYDHFLSELDAVGFDVQVRRHEDHFDAGAAYLYGVNSKEDLILVMKPRV